MSEKNTFTAFNSLVFNKLVDNWTERMMELDHKVTANRRAVDELEKQIDETYKEMEDIQKVANELLGEKVQFNLYENEDNAIRIVYKSDSMNEPKVNIVKDRKIQAGKKPNKLEESYFDTDIEQTVADEETGSWSSIKQGIIGVDEHGKYIQGIKVSVGNTDSEEEPETQHYRVRVPESFTEAPDEENTSDKSLVLSEEDDKTTKSIIEMVSHLDENYLKRLHENLDGTYVYDMEDFHALVTQLFILQEAHKRKGNG